MSSAESHVKPIVVHGDSGFKGTRLLACLKALGCGVRIGDLNRSKNFSKLYTFFDIIDARKMRGILAGVDSIINLAPEQRDDILPLSRYHETNVDGTRQVCLAAEEAGIKKQVFTRRVTVYGFHSFPVDECGPFKPFNP